MLTTRYLRQRYREFNAQVFGPNGGTLPTVHIQLIPAAEAPDYWGSWQPWDHIITIRDDLTPKEACTTLLHEMVHVWQTLAGKATDHGRVFKTWEKRCFRITGLHI